MSLMNKMRITLLGAGLIAMSTPAILAHGSASGSIIIAPVNDRPVVYGQEYGKPFIEVDEYRDSPRRHRYIYGGFEDSQLRFSIYLPPKELYKERFLLMLEGGTGGMDRMLTLPGWEWAFDVAFDDLGAYLIETNEGHDGTQGLGTDNPEHLWQASGYGASYARNIAEQYYGAKPRYGYATGCSGGGTRSSRHVENLPDLINGSVSQAWGHLGLEQWSVYGLAGKMLGDKMDAVRDAMEVGGSGDPYAGLTPMQAEAVRHWLGLGVIRDGVLQWKNTGWFTTPVQMYHIRDTDPDYFEDFWTKPGYAGHDNFKELEPYILEREVTVERLLTAAELRGEVALGGGEGRAASAATYGPGGAQGDQAKQGVIIDYDGQPEGLTFTTITILSGPDKGRILQTLSVDSEQRLLRPFIPRAAYGFNNVNPGDKIKISNRDHIAYIHYYRHSAESTTKLLGLQTEEHQLMFPEFRILMDDNGRSKYESRFNKGYTPQSADFEGKIIALSGTADEAIWPTSMTAYEKRVRQNLGNNASDQFRLWWVDNHAHCGGSLEGPVSTNLVPVTGVTQQALRDLARWVEEDEPPAPDTVYHFDEMNGLALPKNAVERKGIQPVAHLTVNGGDRIEVAAGQPVQFVASAEIPSGAGYLLRAEFDFDGRGAWPQTADIDESSTTMHTTTSHTYTEPGTYFAAFRVGAHRDGQHGNGALIYNLARVRVIVK